MFCFEIVQQQSILYPFSCPLPTNIVCVFVMVFILSGILWLKDVPFDDQQ